MCDDINRRLYYKKLYQQLPMKCILNDLTEDQRELLAMNVVEERSAEEIARILNRDVKEVRWELNKLKTNLRKRARTLVKEPPEFI
jgi:DNA-directed RNA polymerase specialized sigma24 family protein